MKKIFNHPPRDENPSIWRSLRELENDPEFAKHLDQEFPRGAGLYEDSGLSKRDFLKLMGASIALAGVGLTGCRRPEAHLVPFTKGVEWTIPGKFLYYATSMPTRNGAVPLIATTAEGRPTKLEGNPLHPFSNGGTDSFAQAEILNLYDPQRAKAFVDAGKTVDAAAFDAYLQSVSRGGGKGVAFLAEKKNSPTRDRLRAQLERDFPGVLWAEYEPLGDTEAETAAAAAFGGGTRLLPKFERADVILAIDSNFLDPIETGIGYAAGFAARRNPDQMGAPMNRLYVVENNYTVTGGMSDHRLRCRVSDMGEFARRLAKVIALQTSDSALASVIGALPKSEVAFDDAWITECAQDLLKNPGRSLVLAGPQTPAAVQVLVLAINNALGNLGSTLIGVSNPAPAVASITDLAKAIAAGGVRTLFILGGNPAYNAPAELNFASLLAKVPDVVKLGLFEDETSRLSRWHVPAAHFLESWSDVRAYDGTYTSVQPMILPLWGGICELEILSKLLGGAAVEGPELVRATFDSLVSSEAATEAGGLDLLWNNFLRVGFLPGSAFEPIDLHFSTASAMIASKAQPATEALELVFLQSSSVDDGRYANNSWLLETPDFVTKLTWDNAVLVSPATARKLGIKSNNFGILGDIAQNLGNEIDYDLVANVVEITDGIHTIEAAAIVAPGHADDSLSIALGYGRQGVAALMENVGFNAYPLRTAASPRVTENVSLKVTGKTYPLAQTQEHRSMEGRDLFREGPLEHYRKSPAFAQTMGMDAHIPPNISLYTHPAMTSKEQWGMTVDLNTCTGCNACVVACQAENNVPVVGKAQVRKNRDMAWIRIDRYFAGTEAGDPEMVSQPIMCQHCENAPCETVCPVNATVHSDDGLNLMAYNRCIGTRYCANNCPWKVRRFNYFDYNQRPLDELYWGPLAKKGMADSLKMAKNPNVTVRMRGVMEKCTFCIQRIEEAKISRLVEAGPTPKSDTPVSTFKVACQQACPNDSLVFGDVADPESRVSRLRNGDRGYTMFKYLNAAPRVTYLARIKNPNPNMPGADKVGMVANKMGHHESHEPHEPGHKGDQGNHADPTAIAPHGAEHSTHPEGH